MDLKKRALERVWPALIKKIKFTVSETASQCLARGLIPSETLEKLSSLSTDEKATMLLCNVKTTIEGEPDTFNTFVDILEQEPYTKELGERLKTALHDLMSECLQQDSKENESARPLPMSIQETQKHDSSIRKRKVVDHTQTKLAESATYTETFCKKVLLVAVEDFRTADCDKQQQESQIRELRNDAEVLEGKNVQLKREKEDCLERIQNLEDRLQENDKALHEKKEQLKEVQNRLAATEKERNEKDMQLQKLEAEYSKLSEEITEATMKRMKNLNNYKN